MNTDRLIVTASFSPKSLQYPNAWIGHLPFSAWLIKEISPQIFVELGTHSGNSYFSFCQAVVESQLPTKCYAVDTWQGDEHAGQYGDEIFVQVNSYHQANYTEFSRLLRMTFDDATQYFADGSIDLLHIDGRHTYEAVKHDFETWLPKLAPGAVVLFHDTNVRERGFGVWQLWEELQAQYPLHLEFLHSHGLGVLQLAHGPVEKQLSWLAPASPEQQILKNYFAALGSRQAERYELDDQRKAIADRDGQIANFSKVVAQRDEQINAYRAQAEQFDVQLRGAIAQITSFSQALAERDAQIASLTQALTQREDELAALRGSLSMRITAPLRFLSRPVRGSWKEIRRIKERGLSKLSWRSRRICQELTPEQDRLPNDFDPEIYLKLNPDIAAAGNDPATHYSLYGVHEGRSFSLPAMHLQGEHNLTDTRETILVVSHEASRTGAPVLSLNLVQSLVGRYNVVVLLLDGGALTEAFHQAGAVVMTSSDLKGNPLVVGIVVDLLCKRFSFKFALVNSIESREVLPALYDHSVPSVSLVHEFASYTRPRDAFRFTLFWSGEVVFSTKITLENAIAEYPDLRARVAHVLPQGRSFLPSEGLSKQQLEEESARIRRLIRPPDIAEDTVVILGAGSVHIRKGVDLFIECAARVVQIPASRKCRFVWVGKGYDPDNDAGYSVYLADQITRSGLHGHVFFIDETTAIETAYEEADLFLLSSRLDPLPNVAIDAMSHGVPVLCFDKTTGIADFLVDSGLRSYCVAAYLDTAEMAEKILAFVNSQTQYANVATRCREASIAYFNMGKYVARLEDLARDLGCRMQQEQADIQLILHSGLFRPDFAIPPDKKHHSLEEQVRFYVRAWASGLSLRKPFPGCHPGIYLEQHGVADQGADPFADYLREERPEGPWSYPVIVAGKIAQTDLPESKRVALHIHAYYPELLPEIIARLSGNLTCPDLFVSVTDIQVRDQVNDLLKDYRGTVVDIRLVPNRGRDIGPLLTAFGQQILANYDYVGHIHTKKTADLKDANVGQLWYRFLLENLLGGVSGAMADCILARLKEDASIGMAYPDDPNIVGWSANRALAEPLAARIGLEKLPEQFDFPVGTMFWSRTSALAPLVNLNLDWDDYPEEPLPYDGTMLHAIERLLPLTLPLSNLRRATTNAFGLTR